MLEPRRGLWDIIGMKWLAGLFLLMLALPVLAADKITAVTVDGASYVHIQDVHVTSGGRIVILYDAGGVTVTANELPKEFLASWGITDQAIAASRSASAKQAEQILDEAVRAGVFREVEGVVYDMRRSQPDWRRFSDARILQVADGGALVDPTPYQANPVAIFVRNLPSNLADGDKTSFLAKSVGEFSYINKFGYEHTIHAYDLGRVCKRNEIPDAIVKDGQAWAAMPGAVARKSAGPFEEVQPGPDLPAGLRGIGSGFFVTKDGYLLTNFHVVREAERLEVKYKDKTYAARVVAVDSVNDLAVVKVAGADFSPLPISRKDSADLGDEVFTIGFPNIEMQGLEPKYTDGKISSLAGMQDDASEYQISVPVQPGNSGGPLCNPNGEVVGIVVARLNDIAALRESGAVPQNVNYAVKVKHALHLLQTVKGLDMPPSPSNPAAKPIQAVENGIAMVLIY